MMKQNIVKRTVGFLLCLCLIVGLLPGMQVSAQQEVELIPAKKTSSALQQTADALKLEISKMPTTGALRNGRVQLSDFTPSANGSTDMKELRGKHFLVRGENNNHYIIDGSWTGTNGEVPMIAGTHVDGSAAYFTGSASPARAFEFHYRGISSNGMPLYVLRFNNGRNLAVGSRYTNWNNLYYVKGDTTTDLSSSPQVRLEHPNGVNWFRISNSSGTHGFRQASDLTHIRWKDNAAGDNDYAGNALFLYRLWSTRELIAAIHDMKGYLDTPEFFDDEVFAQFLVCLRESIDLFRKYNPWPASLVDPYDFIQEKLDRKEQELRSFASRLSFEFEAPPAAELEKKTTIHQLPLACGYVIRTREGKIIIMDGGWQENNTEGKYLFSYLQKITGDSTPHIDAWFITHAHADHHGCVPTFANLYKDQVTIDAFYYHYPTYDEIRTYLSGCGIDDTWGAVDWIPTWLLPNFKNAQGGPTKGIICNTKQSGKCNNAFDFDDVHIEILLTFEDCIWAADNIGGTYSGTSANEGRVFSNKTLKQLLNDNFNETSMVFRVTVGGKSILFTGDINYVGGTMLNRFHDLNAANPNDYFTLKSDYVQVSHHGHYGLPKKVYNKIDPDVAMWPCNYDEWNDYDYQNLICTKQWFNDMGAKSYVAYQGPHIFEFPLVRSDGAISIPSELKDYVFDPEYYSAKYPDLAQRYGSDRAELYYHFVNYGIEEGRSASPFFDVKYYANQNGHHLVDTFKGNYIAAFQDFLKAYQTNTPRRLSDLFDATAYASFHPELAQQGITTNFDLLKHYVANGYQHGEVGTTTFLCSDRNMTYHYTCQVYQPVPPTCTEEGSTVGARCTICNLILKTPTVLPPTGHNFVNGVCACGARDAAVPILDSNLKLNHTLNLASDISVNFAVKASLLTGFDMDTVYLEVVTDVYEGNLLTGSHSIRLTPVANGDYYYFTLNGMTAVYMNNELRAVLHGIKDGLTYYSETDVYSIAQYAYSQMDKNGTEETLKTLCADLLRYGAAAQRFKGYRTDALADGAMTNKHKSYLSDIGAVSFGNTDITLQDLESPCVTWAGKALNLDSKVTLKYAIRLANYQGRLEDLSLHVTYTNLSGEKKTAVVTDLEEYNPVKQLYAFSFDGLLAAELRTVVSAQIFAGDAPVSCTLKYSADTYGNGKTGALGELCKALFAYSDSAKLQFVK